MIARAFKPVGWVAAVGAAALGCYMLSLQVAAERAELAGVERRIVQTRQQIRSLQTELGTRGRLQQLEHWNAEVLALSAPGAGQFLESNLSLARFDVRQRTLDDHARVRMASAESAPAAPAGAAQAPVRLAAAQAPTSSPVESAAHPLLRRASLVVPPAPTAAAAGLPSPSLAMPPGPAMTEARAPSLLDDATLRALGAESRAERGGGTRN